MIAPAPTTPSRVILPSSHLEAGHYSNPHAQRIIEGKLAGAKLAVMDPRLSNTASVADYWLPTYPGSEAAVLLAMANVSWPRAWPTRYSDRTNWRDYMGGRRRSRASPFRVAPGALARVHARVGVRAACPGLVVEVARPSGRAWRPPHAWRGSAAATRRWQVARALQLLTVLTASVGTPGGTSPHGWNKYKPVFWEEPPGQKEWNEPFFSREWPLSHYEMSFLLALPEGGRR
jgi:hypothetical protein